LALPAHRTLVEQPSFAQCVERLGGARRIDRALDILMDGLCRRPESFPLVGDHGLRRAKTDPIWDDDTGERIPALRLFFQIGDRAEIVLWWIEPVPEEDELPV
jgi:hypothetical protein